MLPNDRYVNVFRGKRGDLIIRKGHVWLALAMDEAIAVADQLVDLAEQARET